MTNSWPFAVRSERFGILRGLLGLFHSGRPEFIGAEDFRHHRRRESRGTCGLLQLRQSKVELFRDRRRFKAQTIRMLLGVALWATLVKVAHNLELEDLQPDTTRCDHYRLIRGGCPSNQRPGLPNHQRPET